MNHRAVIKNVAKIIYSPRLAVQKTNFVIRILVYTMRLRPTGYYLHCVTKQTWFYHFSQS